MIWRKTSGSDLRSWAGLLTIGIPKLSTRQSPRAKRVRHPAEVHSLEVEVVLLAMLKGVTDLLSCGQVLRIANAAPDRDF